MTERKVIILQGLPASGKTAWAKQWCLIDPEHRIRINQDDIRNMLGKYWVIEREPLVTEINENIINESMHRGYDIVIDNMNLDDMIIEKIKDKVEAFNKHVNANWKYKIEYKTFFDQSLEDCIERDSKRGNPIGETVIRSIYEKYKDKIKTKYSLYVDRLYSIWNRTWYEVEANSLDEAIKMCIDGDIDSIDTEDIYESATELTPYDNNGKATLEVYQTDDDKQIYKNAES